MKAYLREFDLWEFVENDREPVTLPANPTLNQIKRHTEESTKRKRNSTSSISPWQESGVSNFNEARLLYDGQNIDSPANAALVLENIKQEVEGFDADYSLETPASTQSASKRKLSIDARGIPEADFGTDSMRRVGSVSLKSCKIGDESLAESGETSFALFASLLDSTLQGA
ncbi:hypothetical protein SLEP1_g21226 [Rubroshorea leprosula]|uniref:Uncharacterized protein n=1 Tax=Rubroshorea leprosula TaxID=152421 RepID=A0AAV5JBA2_9ROSI|nr:hypothetical protein SLEP1_g21226 [Rubroshorea leprosula]